MYHATSLSATRLAAVAITMLVTIVLFAFAPKAHAQDRHFGPIVRIADAVQAQARTPLQWGPTEMEARSAPVIPSITRMTFVFNDKDDKGNVIETDSFVLECLTTGRAACNLAKAAIVGETMSYQLVNRRHDPKASLCAVRPDYSVSCGKKGEGFALKIRNAMQQLGA